MTRLRVNGIQTILNNTELVRNKNKQLWRSDSRKLKERLRGNGWTIFRRLICDYRNHLGNGKRERLKLLPYVDTNGYLFTSPALIAHAEGKAMSNLTVSRWIGRFQEEFELDGEHFIMECKPINRDCMRLKLNEKFFVLENQKEGMKQGKQPLKPPEQDIEHIALSKLAKKFNRKHHNR